MRVDIRQLGDEINQRTVELRKRIYAMENHMDKCVCDYPVMFDFSNVLCSGLHSTYCLNCGGRINY